MPSLNGTMYTDDGRMELHNEALPYIPAADDVWINGTLHHGAHGHMIVSGSAFEGATDVFINGYRHTQHGVRYIMLPPAVTPSWVEGFSVEAASANAGRMPIEGAAAVTSSRGAGRIATGEVCVEVVAGTDAVNVTPVTIQEFSTAPAIGEKEAGYEVQANGNTVAVTNEDNGAGPPTFNTLNVLTDWIDNKSYSGTYHARFTQTGGSGSLVNSAPLNVWREIGVDSAIWLLGAGNGAGFQDFVGTIEISDDGGSTTLDSASLTFETNEI